MLYHNSKTGYSHYSLLFNRKQGVLGTRLSISRLEYLWLFFYAGAFLFPDMHLSWFSSGALPITNIRNKFRNTSFVLSSFWPAWRRPKYQCTFQVWTLYRHSGTGTSHSILCFIRKQGVIGTSKLISCLVSSWLVITHEYIIVLESEFELIFL